MFINLMNNSLNCFISGNIATHVHLSSLRTINANREIYIHQNQNKFILYLYQTKKKDKNFYYLEINEKSRINKDLILTNENKITW